MGLLKRILPIVCLCLLVSCGYRMVGKTTHLPPGINSVAIPTFKNLTYEPGIEVPFTQAFLNELIQDRRVNVVDREQADAIIEGKIRYFSIYSVSYDQSGFVAEYQANVVLDVSLKNRAGEILWEEKNISETRWYRASSDVLTNEANKAIALQETGKLVAERIRNRFFYDF